MTNLGARPAPGAARLAAATRNNIAQSCVQLYVPPDKYLPVGFAVLAPGAVGSLPKSRAKQFPANREQILHC